MLKINHFNSIKVFYLVAFLLCTMIGYGQTYHSNIVYKNITLNDSIFQFDTLSTVPNTLQMYSESIEVPDSLYAIDELSSTLFWKGNLPITISLVYRQFPIDFHHLYKRKDSSIISSSETAQTEHRFITTTQHDVFEMGGLNRTGSISRGVMFGNNQDLSINSNLNLQLSGKVSEDISILASITDDNLPIQPEGNTEQLQDFDQVFIQLFSDNWKLTAGDYWLKNSGGYFLKYNKRGQGASFSTKKENVFAKHKNASIVKSSLESSFSAAISKGKFARNSILGIEGNQGPYKLKGDENEQFIIVLSGTERVYINGKLLIRGQENDYVIDYNTSEITFTPKQLITKDIRIVVEFQYSDKNYARSLLASNNSLTVDRWKISINVYSEQDSKNQPLQQELKPTEKDILAFAGDDILAAVAPSIDSVGFNSDQVLYKKVDSLGYQVYVQSSNSDSAFFQLIFSDVGQGNGNYIEDEFGPFGRVFKWIKPDTINGILLQKGKYKPIKILVSPKQRQMATLGIERKLSKYATLISEVAYSNKDLNTFSSLDAEDNLGYGAKTGLKINRKLPNSWQVKSNIEAETQSKHFNRIERYRDVEFSRNWNVLNIQNLNDQYLGNASISFSHPKNGNLSMAFNTYQITDMYSGYKNDLKLDWKKGIQVNLDGSYLLTNGENNTSFLRHKGDISKNIGFARIGYKDDHEMNLFQTGDSLWKSSYQYYDWEVYVQNNDSSKNLFRIFYKERIDQLTGNNKLQRATYAKNPGLSFSLNSNRIHRLKIRSMLRILDITDTTLTTIKPDNTLLNRLEYNLRVLKGGVTLSTFYEIGSGLELKKEFVYIEVPAGQGVYTWIDYNENNIKDLNEFEVAAFPDQATYIRVFTPSNTYVKIFSNQYNQVLSLNPRYFIKKKSGLLGIIRRLNTQTSLRAERKTSLDDFAEISNPFLNNIADTALQSLSNSFRNSSFFNRSNPKFGIEHTYVVSQNKLLLVNGFDSREIGSQQLKIRWNLSKKFTLQVEAQDEYKFNSSEYSPTKNYQLHNELYELKFSLQPNTTFRTSLSGKYQEKINSIDLGGEQAYISNIGLELKYNQVKKGALHANINYVQIHYIGDNNTSIAFEMLEALQPGSNFTWNLSFQRTLANNLQITINYTGRKTEENFPIHTGGIQVRAFF